MSSTNTINNNNEFTNDKSKSYLKKLQEKDDPIASRILSTSPVSVSHMSLLENLLKKNDPGKYKFNNYRGSKMYV